MNPLSSTYRAEDSPSLKMTPAQEAAQRQREQRIKGLGRPGGRPQDPLDMASATLKNRLGKTVRGKPASEFSTALQDIETNSPAQEYEQLLAVAESQTQEEILRQARARTDAQKHAQEQVDASRRVETKASRAPSDPLVATASSGTGAGLVTAAGMAMGNRIDAQALLEQQLDELYRASDRIRSDGTGVADALRLLEQMRDAARALPPSAYAQGNAATHAERIEGGFDFLQGYFSERGLSPQQQSTVQQAIAQARAAVEDAARQAGVVHRAQAVSAGANLDTEGLAPTGESGAGQSDAGARALAVSNRRPARAAALPQQQSSLEKPLETQPRGTAELGRAREKLQRYQETVDDMISQLSAMTTAGAGSAQAQVRQAASLRSMTPEISLLRLERAGDVSGPARSGLLNRMAQLAQACEDLPASTAGKQELAKAISLEQRRLGKEEDKALQAGNMEVAHTRHVRQLHEDRHKQDTVLKINTGTAG